jgi:hypothetical protein
MPRLKREVAIEQSKLASREELEGLDRSALIVQREKHVRLLNQMVGNLYPRMVSDTIVRIDELLEEI